MTTQELLATRIRDRLGEIENQIDVALLEWACEGADYEAETADDMLVNVVRRLGECNCSGASAPAGLIYNGDIYAQVADWGFEIDETLADYEDARGAAYGPPGNTGLTIGTLVWFAVEWRASELASRLSN